MDLSEFIIVHVSTSTKLFIISCKVAVDDTTNVPCVYALLPGKSKILDYVIPVSYGGIKLLWIVIGCRVDDE